MNYYNDVDPFVSEWLRRLISAKQIPGGYVDSRPIQEVQPEDLVEFKQCHFFAGIAGWSVALRLAGVPEDYPLWTGSCPCQPFSVANTNHGAAKGKADERHLWPEFFRLIRAARPVAVFGEQVESAINHGWLDEVFADVEAENYSTGAAVLGAHSAGFDHVRQRLFWIAAIAGSQRREGYESVQCLPSESIKTSTLFGDGASIARRALEGDYGHLLSGDGVSLQVERNRARGYGNAIVPQVAAEFVRAYFDAIPG